MGAAIDWRSPGIQTPQPVAEWLKQLEERVLTSCLIELFRRNSKSGGAPIRPWAYFKAEISKLLAGSQDLGSPTTPV